MKRKLLFGLTAIFLTTTAYALQEGPVKLIHHREWTTGSMQSKLICKEEPVSLNSHATLKLTHNNTKITNYIAATAHVGDVAIAPLGAPSYFEGKRGLRIYNFSKSVQIYVVTLSICMEKDRGSLGCTFVDDTYELPPNQSFTSNQKATLSYIFDAPGNYTVSVAAEIENTDGIYNFGTYASRDIIVPA